MVNLISIASTRYLLNILYFSLEKTQQLIKHFYLQRIHHIIINLRIENK